MGPRIHARGLPLTGPATATTARIHQLHQGRDVTRRARPHPCSLTGAPRPVPAGDVAVDCEFTWDPWRAEECTCDHKSETRSVTVATPAAHGGGAQGC
jgi:hypothetical protein